jgi:hypothetical protein
VDKDSVTTIEVLLRRVINTEGRMSFEMKLPDDYSCIEVLGMLSAGQAHVYKAMLG